MDTIDKLKQDYELGLPVLKKLFKLNKEQLVTTLETICSGILPDHYNHLFKPKNVRVTKIIVDDEESEIKVEFYDALKITPFGVNVQPEHGQAFTVVKFNKTFTLDNL